MYELLKRSERKDHQGRYDELIQGETVLSAELELFGTIISDIYEPEEEKSDKKFKSLSEVSYADYVMEYKP